jgi:hypothetical protein
VSNRRVWGLFSETEEQARRREADEVHHRRNRDAAGNARQRANDAEAERKRNWEAIKAEGRAQQQYPDGMNSRWSPSGTAPADQDTPEERAARQHALGQLHQTEGERQREWQARRTAAGQKANAARAAMDSALEHLDDEAYAAAHARFGGLAAFCDAVDSVERTRRELASRPNIPHEVE